ncbi:MAG: SGNH/GDSL hydrolase family protein [Saprospiraceae bacterium]
MTTRRNFLRFSALSTFTATVIPELVLAANKHLITSPLSSSSKSTTILFQGDSITDAGRDRGRYYANMGSGMGEGYVHNIVTQLLGKYPEMDYHCYNRGISGHKVFQLAERWDDDCLQLKPDVLSILIGVNDYWHKLNGNYDGTVEIYENDYRALLERTKQELPQVKLIIAEPFAVAGGTAINEKWAPFTAYRQVAKKIATEFGAVFLPYHSMFEESLKIAPASYWCPDGVHPSLAGAYLMKEAWLAGFEKLKK